MTNAQAEAVNEALELANGMELPQGVTRRQLRLAALKGRVDVATEKLRLAGYAYKSAQRNGKLILAAVGTKRAELAIATVQADRAKGLYGLGLEALSTASKDLKELDGRDRLGFGLKAVELAHSVGEGIERQGSGMRWRYRVRRAMELMARLTEARLNLPPYLFQAAEKRHARRELQRQGMR